MDAVQRRIASFTLMDDLYMRKFFDGQPQCAEAVLRAVLDRSDLRVLTVDVDHGEISLEARSARLDVLAIDVDGRRYDVEIQRDTAQAHPKRARFYAALMDAEALPRGAAFEELPESYVIFIAEGDALGYGIPICHADRVILETGDPLEDESHVVYVDATYNYGDTELGDVMHDFRCPNPDEMRCPVLADRARQLKGTETEGAVMGQSIAETVREIREEATEAVYGDVVRRMLADGEFSRERIAGVLGITPDQVDVYARGEASEAVDAPPSPSA